MINCFKNKIHYFIFFFILFASYLIFEPRITPDTKSYIATGENLINFILKGNINEFLDTLLQIDIFFKIISILNISILFQLIGENAKYILVIINLILYFYIFNINCTISKKLNPISNNRCLFLIIIFFSFFYIPVFLLTFNVLTEIYFQCICILYLKQLYFENYKLKKLFLLAILSLLINPMGIVLIGFTSMITISKYSKLNIYFLILSALFLIIFAVPFILDYSFKASYFSNTEIGRMQFLEKGNIIYFFLYYEQGDLRWCESYCNFVNLYQSLKSNSNYLDYLISGLLRIYYFIYPVRPYFSLNHNILISISMLFIYAGFFLSFVFHKFKNYLPFYFILLFVSFFVITPLTPNYRYQSVFYLMLIPNSAIFYNILLNKFYEKYFN